MTAEKTKKDCEGGPSGRSWKPVVRWSDRDGAVNRAGSLQRFGRLDVLIDDAGVMPIGKLDDLAVDDWARMVDVNIKSVLWGIAEALPATQTEAMDKWGVQRKGSYGYLKTTKQALFERRRFL